MQSADLLAIANVAPPPAASQAASTGREDADAFARALADEMDAARAAADAGDGRCGTSGDGVASGAADVLTPERPARPDRGSRSVLQGLLGGLWRGDGSQGGLGGLKNLTDTITAGSGAGAKPDPFKPGPLKGQGAFREALDALGAAINEALKDPSASTAAQGQLPAPVQAALDQVLAAAPPGMSERLAAFAGKLSERLAALLAKGDGPGDPTAPEVSAQPADAKGAEGVLSQALAALGDMDTAPMPDIQETVEPARTAASPAATTSGPLPSSSGEASGPSPAAPAGAPSAAELAARSADASTGGADGAAPIAPEPATAESMQALVASTPSADPRAAAAAAVRGSPETVAMLASTIARKLEGRTTHFDMELHPAEFGRVDVRLRIDSEGRVAAQMAFDNPVAAADLRARADELRRQLEQAGFQVASEDLTFTDKGAGGFDQNPRNAFAGMDADAGGRARARAFADGERAARLADDAGRLQRRNLTGLDVRV